MAIDILARTDFWDLLPITRLTLELSESIESKSTAGGEILRSSYGARNWFGQVTLNREIINTSEETRALIRRIQRPDVHFIFTPRHFDRSALTDGTLYSVDNGRSLRFAGLAPGVLYKAGTFFSLFYGGSHRLHQLAASATVNGSGILGPVEIVPDLVPGWALNSVVNFTPALCRACYVPGSMAEAEVYRSEISGVSFRFRQVLL